jgi:exosortase/archaeosortase family protein
MEAKILFVSAVAASPGPLSRRAAAAIGGLAVLFLTNVIRIASLYFIGVQSADAFEVAHREVWPLLLVGMAALEFLLWARWIGPASPGAHSGARAGA